MHAAPPSSPTKHRRPRTIVPAPVTMLRSMPGGVDGLDVLHDVERVLRLPEDDALALFLWLALRRVVTWAAVPVEERGKLRAKGQAIREHLAGACEHAPELATALNVLHRLWAQPGQVAAGTVADACVEVARWATRWGLAPTAVLFAEAAAAAEPENAARAIEAGEGCQRLGGSELMQRAEQWFQRAFGLARVSKHGRKLLSIRALLAYGNWAREMGYYPLAEKCYTRAASRARRYERPLYYAVAHHNLLGLAVLAAWELPTAEEHAREAFTHYPLSDARLPNLAHDYANLLLRHGCSADAFRLLHPLPAAIKQQEVQPIVYGTLAWAAAATGQREVYEEAKRNAVPLASIYTEFAAETFRYIAEGALLMDERKEAFEYAEIALRCATERSDGISGGAATRLLTRLAQEQNSFPQAASAASRGGRSLISAFLVRLGLVQTQPEPSAEPDPAARKPRKRSVCPAPTWELWGGVETLAGLTVLQEVDPNGQVTAQEPFALLLWRTLRRVRTWALTDSTKRVDLCTETAANDGAHLVLLRPRIPELAGALAIFHALLHFPNQLHPEQLAHACNEVGRWASARGSARTAVFFAEAAAIADPESAARAIEAGETCQRCGGAELTGRAEQWLQRAFDLARTAARNQRLLAIRALLAYGNLAREVGEYTIAKECYTKALRRSRHYGRWTYFAIAHHNLLTLAVLTTRDLSDGELHAEQALERYPQSDRRVLHLMHDYGALLNIHQLYSSALHILAPLPQIVKEPEVLPILYGSLAWAAAGAGRQQMYEKARDAALNLVPRYGDNAADTLRYVAEGALLVGDRVGAARYAERAREIALARNEEHTTRRAAALLTRINSSEPALRYAEAPAQARTAWILRSCQARLSHRAFQLL